MTDRHRIGFAGTGLMGLPMARRLVEAGHEVSVWNRTAEKAAPLVDAGAVLSVCPADLTRNCEFVFLCLTDGRAVEQVVFGADGLVSSKGASIVVDFSTIHPDATRSIADRLGQANGMRWIDAPVSGGVPGAEAGTLAIMAGGDPEDIELVRPAVASMCQRFTRMGDTGAGQATKLVNQIISGCTMAIVAEAVAFAERTGVDAGRLTEALAGGFADSMPFRTFAPRMAGNLFEDPLGTTNMMIKDLDTVTDVGATAGAALPMVESALAVMRARAAEGEGELDISAIVKHFR